MYSPETPEAPEAHLNGHYKYLNELNITRVWADNGAHDRKPLSAWLRP